MSVRTRYHTDPGDSGSLRLAIAGLLDGGVDQVGLRTRTDGRQHPVDSSDENGDIIDG
jgi:hypothetical protein